eukprot:TRINITY_DN5518_c0_g1_i4.p1 TRINITY_DN5518_c0_g1~~TRINITY_DN5518_c0_g1_i4.p1  ORF type:complete len:139 (-),score=38.01 TRINITY_DN5518_c0_g1_i4:107-523(-)
MCIRDRWYQRRVREPSNKMFSGYGANDDIEVAASDQRTRLMNTDKKIDRTTGRIRDAHQTAAQIEAQGVSVLGELATQNESLLRTRDKTYEIEDNMKQSKRIMMDMTKTLITNKLILVGIIILLLGCIGLIIYFKFIK